VQRRAVAVRALLFGALIAASTPGSRGAAAAATAPRTHEVLIQGLAYLPPKLEVRRGDVVVWINKDPFPHTATAAGRFDSGSIAPGGSWRFTATRSGSFAYLCSFHPTMTGTLRVD
jgi:plastocyanin